MAAVVRYSLAHRFLLCLVFSSTCASYLQLLSPVLFFLPLIYSISSHGGVSKISSQWFLGRVGGERGWISGGFRLIVPVGCGARGVMLPTGGGHGVPGTGSYWDTCLISIWDGWREEEKQYRRLIMQFEKRRRSKTSWKRRILASQSENESAAQALCQSTWTLIWGLLYIWTSQISSTAKSASRNSFPELWQCFLMNATAALLELSGVCFSMRIIWHCQGKAF